MKPMYKGQIATNEYSNKVKTYFEYEVLFECSLTSELVRKRFWSFQEDTSHASANCVENWGHKVISCFKTGKQFTTPVSPYYSEYTSGYSEASGVWD